MVKNTDNIAVISLLKSLNVCRRCILRFIGLKSYSSYTSVEKINEALKSFEEENKSASAENENEITENIESNATEQCEHSQSKRFHPSPCIACLGILQKTCDGIVDKIVSVVQGSGYQFNDFVLQLSYPVAADLRQRLLYLHLKHHFRESYEISENDIPSTKDVWKWVVGPQLGKVLNADFTPNSDFQISVSISYPDTVGECSELYKTCPSAFPNRKKKKAQPEDIYTRTAVINAMNALSTQLEMLYPLPPSVPVKSCTYEDIFCTHSPLYIGGRYNKYSRELSQTPWVVDGERRMESSVQELITDVVQKWIIGDKIVFSASGREDVDVKMLGNGRPFVLEVLNPRRSAWSKEEMKKIQEEINKSTEAISIRDLQIVSKKEIQFLKEGEEEKRKSYSAVCIVKKALSEEDLKTLINMKDVTLKQKTPIRVLHRRPLAIRERIIHKFDGKLLNSHTVQLKLQTQAGTYVKEFIHSDFGRTTPNLGTLLSTEADILELDVESIDLDWPPTLNS